MKRRWLITGANGFVGRHFLDLLYPSKDWVGAFVLPKSGKLPSWVKRYEGKIENWEEIQVAVRKARPTHVLHLAAMTVPADCDRFPRKAWNSNVLGSIFLLEALRQQCPKARVLLVSSAYVYRQSKHALTENSALDPNGMYGLSKRMMEKVGLNFVRDGSTVFIARSFNHIGPGQSDRFVVPRLASQIAAIETGKKKAVLKLGNLRARRDFLDVRDVVRAYRLILEKGKTGSIYNVASGKGVEISKILETLKSLSPAKFAIEVEASRLRQVDPGALIGSSSKLRRELGWNPKYRLKQSLEDVLDQFRSN